MTTRHDILITSSDGATDATSIVFGRADIGSTSQTITIRILNADAAGTTSDNRLYCVRADLLRADPAGEEALDTQRSGGELVTECWLEAKIGAGSWTPLDEYANYLSLGPIVAGSYVTVSLRLNVPSTATTFGDVDFALIVRSR